MSTKLKSIDSIAKKYVARASTAAPDYADGVKNPSRPWAASTEAAATTYASGVQQAVADGRFAKGVAKAGDAKWQGKAASVGAQRYPAGVAAAAPYYVQGVQPYLDVLSNITLPPRMPKGDPANIQRVTAVTSALRAKKLQG